MDFQHEQSWQYLETVLSSKLTTKEAWDRFIQMHDSTVPGPYWTEFRSIDVESEHTDVVNWIQQVIINSPMPEEVIALWIGIFKSADDASETPTIYLAGADRYDKDDADWACDPSYQPDNGYAQPTVLQQIDLIAKKHTESYQFLDWILPLAWCAFTFDEIIRSRLDKSIFKKDGRELFITVGHDGGDYINLTPIK